MWRIVYQRKALGFSYKKIATNLGVDIANSVENSSAIPAHWYCDEIETIH